MPLVSVCMITYNHEQYIRMAIESVLAQKTNFPFEIVIGEDCSFDRTRAICSFFNNKFPTIIRLLDSSNNLGITKNLGRTLKACKGKYISILEGDDYWTDPLKLQKQIEFLEKNEEFAACFAGYYIVDSYNQGKLINNVHPKFRSDKTLKDILRGYTIHPRTLFYRNSNTINKVLINSLSDCYNGDIALSYLITSAGPVKYMDEIFAAYRIHAGGVFSSKDFEFRYNNIVKTYTSILKLIEKKSNRNILKRTIAIIYNRLAVIKLKDKNYYQYIIYLKCVFKYNKKTFLRALIHLFK